MIDPSTTYPGFSTTLGVRVLEATPEYARLELPISDAILNPIGIVHGGAIASLIDDAGTVTVMAAQPNGRPGVTTDLNVSYLRPAKKGPLCAKARWRRVGQTLAFAEVEVFDGEGKTVALGRVTKFLDI